MMSEGNWTVERDEDLTGPYAFSNHTWVAFDDPTSIKIKVNHHVYDHNHDYDSHSDHATFMNLVVSSWYL